MSLDTPRDEPEYGAAFSLSGGDRQTLTKDMIVAAIRRRFPHYSRKIVREVVEMSFEEIMIALVADGSAKLHGFGKFVVLEKSERAGRNPRTGAKLSIAAHKVVAFKASPNLSAMINASRNSPWPGSACIGEAVSDCVRKRHASPIAEQPWNDSL